MESPNATIEVRVLEPALTDWQVFETIPKVSADKTLALLQELNKVMREGGAIIPKKQYRIRRYNSQVTKCQKVKDSDTAKFLSELFEGNDTSSLGFQMAVMNRMILFIKGFEQSKVKDFRDTEKGFDGMWGYYRTPNGGGFKAIDSQTIVEVEVESNYFSGRMTMFDACLGCNLFAFSLMSFSQNGKEGRIASVRFHQLRSYVLDNLPEDRAAKLMQMID